MIRACLITRARNIFVAGFFTAAATLGVAGVAPTASARSYFNPPSSVITVQNEDKHESLTVLAQRDRIRKRRDRRKFQQRRRQKNRSFQRRRQKTRGFTNRQSNSAISAGRAASLGTVARSVRRRVPGQLLDARLMKDRRGNLTYKLKILSRNGVMRNVTADAYTGAILGIR